MVRASGHLAGGRKVLVAPSRLVPRHCGQSAVPVWARSTAVERMRTLAAIRRLSRRNMGRSIRHIACTLGHSEAKELWSLGAQELILQNLSSLASEEGLMSSRVGTKAFVAACGLAVAIAGAACNRNDTAEVDRDTDRLAADAAKQPGHKGAPITITGCLQRGSGLNNFILTQVNSPSDTPVATTGKDSSGAAVQREQMREAKHAYTLDGDKDALRDLVGKQV